MSDIGTVCSRRGDQAAGLLMNQARLADLDGYWLELHCCRGTTLLPCHYVAQHKGAQRKLGDVIARLRCKMCGGPPVRAWLNETTNRASNNGPPPGWSVQLVPLPGQVDQAEAAE